jgi:hypothetical protein
MGQLLRFLHWWLPLDRVVVKRWAIASAVIWVALTGSAIAMNPDLSARDALLVFSFGAAVMWVQGLLVVAGWRNAKRTTRWLFGGQ